MITSGAVFAPFPPRQRRVTPRPALSPDFAEALAGTLAHNGIVSIVNARELVRKEDVCLTFS